MRFAAEGEQLFKHFYQDNSYSNVSYSKALEGNPGSLH